MVLRKACKEFSPEEIFLQDGVHLTANEVLNKWRTLGN